MRTTTLATALLLFVLLAPVAPAEQREVQVCGTYPSRGIAAAAQHRYLVERRDVSPFRLEAFQTTIDTTGDLVVIADDGLIVAEANVFDLRGRSLSFEPSGESGYRVRSGSAQVEPALGDPQPIGDDATVTLELDFEFAYFGSRYSEVFLNSDGNLSFTRGDSASTERSLGRVLSGPPRIAVFFDDLDPSAGGEVLVHRSPDRLVVTWSRVPEWSKTLPNTFQVVLTADGRIETRYPDGINASSSVIGLSPGDNPETVDIVDLGGAGGESEGALLERFQSKRVVDNVALSKQFYQQFPDRYDALVVWTNFESDLDDAFAFHITAKNDTEGIGDILYDNSDLWGSDGRLESFIFMGNLNSYPASPTGPVTRAASQPTALGLVAHEVGHRWLAQPRVALTGVPSNVLLGRQQSHWSFFFDSDASFLEGNDIEQEADNRFRTVGKVACYSRLDLYLMGMAPASEVSPLFVVTDASGTDIFGDPLQPETMPRTGVGFTGTRTDVTLADVESAIGPRRPSFETSQKEFRQAWILLTRPASPPSSEEIAQLQAAMNAWRPFFSEMTHGRGSIITEIVR